MEPRIEIISSEPSWVIETDAVRLALTLKGGHMAPVTFFRTSGSPVQPYYVSPWQGEGKTVQPPVLGPLRGDFFCMPFGGDSVLKGVAHTTHGEPATGTWRAGSLQQSDAQTRLTLTMDTSALKGRITKAISLVRGQNAVYIRHVLEGYDVRTSLGHHATLAGGDRPDALLLSTSPVQFGRVSPRPPGTFVSDGEYSALLAGAEFRSLDKVPTVWKEMPFDSCASYPRRRGFCDLIQVYNKQARGPAWVTAVNPAEGWLWFALKDPAVQPSTLFWMENHGRYADPWKGRNCALGLEDVCGYFAMGLAASVKKNDLNEKGIPTARKLSPARPTAVNYIQGVTRVPKGFGRVRTARFQEGSVTFVGESGKTAAAAVDHGFLFSGAVGAMSK
ncbi:MAG TPA: hypothetical protein VFB30_18780 [Spirochaetia bacterium]|nr:hypothetical protein [Spirochaetia bacterium]